MEIFLVFLVFYQWSSSDDFRVREFCIDFSSLHLSVIFSKNMYQRSSVGHFFLFFFWASWNCSELSLSSTRGIVTSNVPKLVLKLNHKPTYCCSLSKNRIIKLTRAPKSNFPIMVVLESRQRLKNAQLNTCLC